MSSVPTRPNILLIVSDQERQRGWIPEGAASLLPSRQRLMDEGLEFTNHHTHSSPCSPSRASLFTGQYVPQHGVAENVIMPAHRELAPSVPTIGHLLRDAGYRTAYIGKWHLSHSATPDMEAYGFGDWEGNDRHFMGWAGTGYHFDPLIAAQAAGWLHENAVAGRADTRPWFLVVALVNPHDVMWFPIDQPDYQATHPEDVADCRAFLAAAAWKDDDPIPSFSEDYAEVFGDLPANFDDDLYTKPAVQRQWLYEQQHNLYGYLDPADKRGWLRHLDYYLHLHRAADCSLGTVLEALDVSDAAQNTAVVFTSDHGDMCGSHGLRSKGPFVYDEIMRVPLYVRVPGLTRPGTRTGALASHVDLARTIVSLGGVAAAPSLPGVDLTPVLLDPNSPGREVVLFAQDSAWYERCIPTRYAIRGMSDGRFKYARYYGVGGSTTQYGQPWRHPKLFDVGAAFEDQDHELYDLHDDPGELVNLANDRDRRGEIREWFHRLKDQEAEHFAALPTAALPSAALPTAAP